MLIKFVVSLEMDEGQQGVSLLMEKTFMKYLRLEFFLTGMNPNFTIRVLNWCLSNDLHIYMQKNMKNLQNILILSKKLYNTKYERAITMEKYYS